MGKLRSQIADFARHVAGYPRRRPLFGFLYRLPEAAAASRRYFSSTPLAGPAAAVYNRRVKWGDDDMRWLTAILVVLLVGLAAMPAAVDAVVGWAIHRSENVRSISYVPFAVDEFSASRRQRHNRLPEDLPPP
jgi:hypothetical protein